MPELSAPQILTRAGGATIAYRRLTGAGPGVVFLPGFMSDMEGGKALALEAMCRARGQAFVRFDYQGHGLSSGAFQDGTIGRWLEDALAVLDDLTLGPQVLVGSSMGGWIMMLAALARPDRVKGLVGVAAAPDFTDDLVAGGLTRAQLDEVEKQGYTKIPSQYGDPYTFTRALIEDGQNRRLLTGAIDLTCPVRLLHGLEDDAVPWQRALKIQELIAGEDVEVTLVKGGDHRLSGEADLQRLEATVAALL